MVDQIKALSDRPIPEVSQADIGQLRNELETLGKLKETNTQLSDQLIDVVARVSALEKSTIESAIPDDLVAKYREEIESMNAYLDSQRSAIQSFMDDAKTKADAAEKVARDITLRSALDKISIAMDSGLAFEDVIDDLSDALMVPRRKLSGQCRKWALQLSKTFHPALPQARVPRLQRRAPS